MIDEETGAEPRVVSASIADPYLLLIRDDSSAVVAFIDKNDELEELERDDATLVSTKWLTGCLYIDTSGIFTAGQYDKRGKPTENVIMFLFSGTGTFYVGDEPDEVNMSLLTLARYMLSVTFLSRHM